MDSSTKNIDPVLAYLLEFNKDTPIHYKGRRLIPANGLQEMLDNFKRFHLDREEDHPETEPTQTSDIDKLMELI